MEVGRSRAGCLLAGQLRALGLLLGKPLFQDGVLRDGSETRYVSWQVGGSVGK